LGDVLHCDDLADWGPVAAPLDGAVSRTSGRLLHKGPAGENECGIWVCTPGAWRCEVTRDEFCHFLAGRCTYVHDGGKTIEVGPGTIAFFPAGWSGRCAVHETVRKVYMVR
jgi:uncharacterized cupin superfamily protein